MPVPDSPSEFDLVTALSEAQNQIRDLERENADLRWVDEALKKRTHVLNERVKELECLHELATALTDSRRDVASVMNGVVQRLPGAWQFPSMAAARVRLGTQEWQTTNFHESAARQRESLVFGGKEVGSVEIVYLQERPVAKDRFLPEERDLLRTVALLLSHFVEHRWSTRS